MAAINFCNSFKKAECPTLLRLPHGMLDGSHIQSPAEGDP